MTAVQDAIIAAQNSIDYLQAENTSLTARLNNLILEKKAHEELVAQEAQLRVELNTEQDNHRAELDTIQGKLTELEDAVVSLNTTKMELDNNVQTIKTQLSENPSSQVENQLAQLKATISRNAEEHQKVIYQESKS